MLDLNDRIQALIEDLSLRTISYAEWISGVNLCNAALKSSLSKELIVKLIQALLDADVNLINATEKNGYEVLSHTLRNLDIFVGRSDGSRH